VPSSRFTLITPKTLVSSPTDSASSGLGSEHRIVTCAELATDPTQLKSSRACHRHVTFKMEKGNINAYIAKFEQVIRQAGLDVDQPLVVNKFVRGLPREMYDFIYTHKDPQTYEQWRNEVFKAQKRYVHLKNQINDF
jgi:hypothetical protein